MQAVTQLVPQKGPRISPPVETDRYLAVSEKLELDDIDWAEAKRIGLTSDEAFILTYFSDIESQTIVYLRDLLKTQAALEPDVSAFLTIWNYEEYFHGYALARLLKECGYALEDNRTMQVRKSAGFTEALESMAASLLSWIFKDDFPAVHMAWGAVQEMTTLRGYEELARSTKNPVLKTLCDRIAKQERRHFAWYFNNAKDRLQKSTGAQWLTRSLLANFWTPVGAGVKTKAEVKRVISLIFPGSTAARIAEEIDTKIGSLPGLTGIGLMRPYLASAFG